MGFFDNFVDENASSSTSTGGSTSTAVVTESPKKATSKKTSESDFLIIDDSVTIESMPNTASDLFVAETSPVEETPIISLSESTEIISESISTETMEVSSPEIIMMDETPVESEVLEVSDMVTMEQEPEVIATEELAEIVEEVATPVSDTFFTAVAEVKEESPSLSVASEDTSETAVRGAIEKITASIRTKESQRDIKISENERILAQIAELKKQAKSAQDEAREIDKGADHDRKLVEGLKTLIAA